MPLNIDASFQNVNALNLDAFKSAEGTREFKNTTVQVGSKTFKVSFADDGKVSVSFATTSFFHLFQGAAKTAVREKVQELVDLNSLTRDLAKAVSASSHTAFVENTLRKEASAMAGAAGGRYAHYGFSDVRESSARVLVKGDAKQQGAAGGRPALRHQLINDYNVAIRLPGNSDAATMTAFVRDLNAGRSGALITSGGVLEDDAALWRDYLKGHDLDMFSKIRKARTEAADGKTTGWAGEIAHQGLEGAVLDMVRKNIDPRALKNAPDVNFVLLPVARAIIEATDTDFGTKNAKEISAAFREIVQKHAPRGKEDLAVRIFDEVLTSAFWRQTSKRGLDFFKARGETVVFDWSKYDGEETDGTELGNKWWKNGSADVRDQHGAAITNSEMRHLESEKYAQAPGAGRVVRIRGNLTQASAEAVVTRKIDALGSLPKEDLEAMRTDLKAAFDARKVDDFLPLVGELVRDVPDLYFLSWASKDGQADRAGRIAAEAALDRLAARLAAAKSPLVQTAMLANIPTLFKAELLKDPAAVAMLAPEQRGGEKAVDARTAAARTLAGLDHGRGLQAFFAPDTGRPNALGQMLLDAAARDNAPVGDLAGELAAAFAEKFGCAADEAVHHPAFRTFLVRAAPAHRDLGSLIGALDTVKIAHDAKVAVEASLARDAAPAPGAQAVFARRGDWDLNRLVFKEAVAAKAAGRPADLAKLLRNAQVIRDICASAAAFADEVERKIGTPFTEDERNRLVDSYLDRDGSKVCAYRLSGTESDVQKLAPEHADILKRTDKLLADIQKLGAGRLAPSVVKSLVIDGVATRAKEFHVAVAVAALEGAQAGEPVNLRNGGTPAERVTNFVRELAERFRPAFDADYSQYRKDLPEGVGYDDRNTIMRMCFNAYQVGHPEITSFLDDAITEETLGQLASLAVASHADHVIPYLVDIVSSHGTL